jgi:hypothetical protein
VKALIKNHNWLNDDQLQSVLYVENVMCIMFYFVHLSRCWFHDRMSVDIFVIHNCDKTHFDESIKIENTSDEIVQCMCLNKRYSTLLFTDSVHFSIVKDL